jgi:hypothetical protein
MGSIFFSSTSLAQDAAPLPRTIIALYDSQHEGDPRYTRTHRFLEMPLNYLGFIVEYHDIRKPLPAIDQSVRGVLVWFLSDTELDDPVFLFDWLHQALDLKKKLLVMGGIGASEKYRESVENMESVNRLMHRIGVHDRNSWVSIIHDAKLENLNPPLLNFERNYDGEIVPFSATNVAASNARSHLKMIVPQYEEPVSDLIITNDNGGYIARDYGIFQLFDDDAELVLTQWFINPFLFLREVFDDAYLLKPDTTTVNGRRIFYSHLDGDGWNNLSEVQGYQKRKILSSEVLYDQVFKPYDDFAFTVGLIVAELRPDCYGLPDSIPVAKKIMALDNVEPGSHTYSHPLYWGFFADGDRQKEKQYLEAYPSTPQNQFFLSKLILGEEEEPIQIDKEYKDRFDAEDPMRGIEDPFNPPSKIMRLYKTPRSYACEPFNLEKEVQGSIDYIEALSGGKKVKLYQWSGNTTPFEAAIRETRKAGLLNINGGDSRFDTEYPSYATVAPLSVKVGDERQIYSSNSNENTYTNLWTDRFFGFKYLQTTVNNTESPLRVAPYNLYFHTYSGEKDAALTAVKENLEFARKQKLIPLFASEYAAIADSFFEVDIIPLGKEHWEIRNRGALQTFRIDNAASMRKVDIRQSKGVVGYTHYQGALYISLDPGEINPIIKLVPVDNLNKATNVNLPYVIESNWKIKHLQKSKKSLIFSAGGLGDSDILIQWPYEAEVNLVVSDNKKQFKQELIKTDVYNRLHLSIDNLKKPVGVTITLIEE